MKTDAVLTYDATVNAAYIKLSDEIVGVTRELVPDIVLLDLDTDDNIVGIEILGVELVVRVELVTRP